MKAFPVFVFIAAVVVGSTTCFGQGESEIPVEGAEIAVEVAPDGVKLPAELEEQFDRLFDPNEVFLTGAFCKKLADYTKALPSATARKLSSTDESRQRDFSIRREIDGRLRRGLASAHLEIRRRAALALNAIGDNSGVPVMIEDISTANPGYRANVVIALRKMKDRRAIESLIKAADDKVSHIRCIAIEALGEMRAEEAYEVITKHLTDKDAVKGTDVMMLPAESSCIALGELGERKAVPLLIKALEDKLLADEAAVALDKIRLGRHSYAFIGRGQEAFGADIAKWTDWWNWENLDGAAVMVRLYRDWKADPAAYETVTVKVKKHSISFKDIEAGDNSVLAIAENDQTNQLIRKCLKNRIYAFPAKEKQTMRIPRYDSTPSPDKFWFFDDALGDTITDATVEVWLSKYKGPKIKITEMSSDGSFKVPDARMTLRSFEFVVFHPDYGIANASAPFSSESHIPLPLVHRTSPAAQRAISGVVIDPEGNPIEGATIHCSSVRTLGEGLINAKNERCTAITDADGRFRTYMPPSKQFSDQRGKLIPPKSKYSVRIEAPREMDFLPYVGKVENGAETTIVMDSPGSLHTFVFVDEYGVINDPAGLKHIVLTIDMEGDRRIRLGYSDFKDRRLFPNGTYVADLDLAWRKTGFNDRVQTDPVEITDDSPQEIVLRTPDPVTYTGRVVDGVTGEPFAAAYVITMQSICSKRLADITGEQWAAIHRFGDDISTADPAVKPISDAYRIGVITRTDAEGYYAIQPQPGRDFYTFLAFEENYIPVSKRMYPQKPGDPREVDVEILKLFPAAKILVEACVEEKHVSINPKWIVDKGESPAWVRNLLKFEDRQTRFVRYNGWMEQNEPQHVFVPADATFRLQLRMPYDDQWSPFTTEESFKLAHGEVLDIGKIRLQPALKVYVKIVNADAEAVEGVPVRKLVGNHGSVAHNTDENGRVMFYLPPYSRGKFYVADHYKPTADGRYLKEEMPYQVMGREDNNSEFVLQLSDEILYHMFE